MTPALFVAALSLVPAPCGQEAALPTMDAKFSAVRPLSGGYDKHAVVYYDVDAKGAHWARGRAYKACADATGFQFIPFLGSDAPQSYPLRLRLRQVRRGGEPLVLDDAEGALRDDDRLTLERGGVSVRYDFSPSGVEQSFAIESAAGEGDLILDLEVETELGVVSARGGFSFSNELGGVQYSAAVVLDARGREDQVSATWMDGAIRLTVPASFLDEAEWPVIVDPILTPFTVGTSTADLANPDTAYSAGDGRYSVVFEERFSATDIDIYSWYVTPDGVVSDGSYVEQTADSWYAPRVSMLPGLGGGLLVVAEGDSLAVPGSRDIFVRGRTTVLPFFAPHRVDSATSTFTCASPDIGADGLAPDGVDYLVAFNRVFANGRREVYTASANSSGAGTPRWLAGDLSSDTSAPAVSSSSGTCCLSLEHVVGWAERQFSTGASSVRTARIRFDNGLIFGRHTIAGPTIGAAYFDVDVSANAAQASGTATALQHLVTYDDRLASVGDAFVAVCLGGPVVNTYELQLSEHADRTPDQNDLVVASGLGRFMLGYEENHELHMTIVEPINGELAIIERRRVALGSDLDAGSLATAATLYRLGSNWDSLFVWSQEMSGATEIMGAFATGPAPMAAGVQFCYGSANSTGDRGFILVEGTRQVTSPHALSVEALPPNVFGYFLASTVTGNVVGAGGSQGTFCLGGSVGRFGIYQADGSGAAVGSLIPSQIAQPQGPVSATVGQRWHFQSWYRDAVGGVATSNFTNAAAVRFR